MLHQDIGQHFHIGVQGLPVAHGLERFALDETFFSGHHAVVDVHPDELGAGDGGDAQRGQGVGNHVRNVRTQQNQGARDEGRAGQQAVASWKPPTRGGMQAMDVGRARQVVIRVWDGAAEDGDCVQIWVGGRVLVQNLSLTNAGHSFRVTLRSGFTSVKVIALNEGTSPPNTARFAVEAGGRTYNNKWDLKTWDMGSTVIRGGAR